ncbi:MAG: hypothetical protein ACTSYX_12725 [Candidatus Thorarchaeota archaeon]
MAHEALVSVLVLLGIILILGYYFGPRNEVREVKKLEGKIMLIPTGVLLFILAGILYSGIIH